MTQADKIRVLIVDDQMSMRLLIREIIKKAPDMEVVGTASNPEVATQMIKEKQPDVITLDVEMPVMDGITFLQKLMKLKPLPVVMVSTLTAEGSETAVKALELGAVDVIGKPSATGRDLLEQQAEEVIEKVRAAAHARVRGHVPRKFLAPETATEKARTTKTFTTDAVLTSQPIAKSAGPLIAIGSSTGGTEAVRAVLADLPPTLPPIMMVQHISGAFTTTFAERLDMSTKIKVVEARDGMPLENGHAYLAPGSRHMAVRVVKDHYIARVFEGERVNRHLPAVDVLFRSVADQAKEQATGVILTGMGDDGAKGLLEMREAGALTFGQDKATCVVYGMPRVAMEIGAVKHELSLAKIPAAIVKHQSELKKS